MTTPTQTPEQIIKQAYIVATHAVIAAQGIKIGDTVQVFNHYNEKPHKDRNGNPLPPGCKMPTAEERASQYRVYGATGTFMGINADGDVVVRPDGRSTVNTMPYTFIRTVPPNAKQTVVRLNEQYNATIYHETSDGSPKQTVTVGCQRFDIRKLRELLTTFDQIDKDALDAKKKAPVAPTPITANPTPTYVATAPAAKKAAKKAPAKKAATKTPAKKVAKKQPAAKKAAVRRNTRSSLAA